MTLSPVPIALGSNITWSPGLSFTNNTDQEPAGGHAAAGRSRAGCSTRSRTTRAAAITALSFDTPIRIGGFNWQNSLQVNDQRTEGREVVTFRTDNPATPDPTRQRSR